MARTGEPDPFILLDLAFSIQETYTSEVRTTPDGQSDTSWAGDKGQAAASQPSAVRLVHVNAADVLVRRGQPGRLQISAYFVPASGGRGRLRYVPAA